MLTIQMRPDAAPSRGKDLHQRYRPRAHRNPGKEPVAVHSGFSKLRRIDPRDRKLRVEFACHTSNLLIR